MSFIEDVVGREILDSRGNPTIVITSYSIHYTKLYDLLVGPLGYLVYLIDRTFFSSVKSGTA